MFAQQTYQCPGRCAPYRLVAAPAGVATFLDDYFGGVFFSWASGPSRRADGEGVAGGGLRHGRRAVRGEKREAHRCGAASSRECDVMNQQERVAGQQNRFVTYTRCRSSAVVVAQRASFLEPLQTPAVAESWVLARSTAHDRKCLCNL